MTTEKVGPTALGKIVIVLFILGCLAAAGWFFRDTIFPGRDGGGTVDMDKFREQQGGAEAMDPTGITTVTEYKYIPAQKLPPVKGTSAYKWDTNKVVEFPINVWIGWLPIVAANNGFAPSTESVFYKKYGFKVNLKLIDDPVAARDAYAAGNSHILWGTLDMMALFAPELMKDSRTAPRIYQQIDWSNGGDGIVVRSKIASVRDLKGRTIVYAQNSPSQYFINNLLLNAGIQPGEVKHKFTSTAFEAAAAFVADPSIDACVSWAPDIYNIPEKVKNTRILTTTAEANKLIADVWAARADFAKDHPEIIEGLVAGIFEGMRMLKDDTQKARAFQWMAEGYGMAVDEIRAMEADAHTTNFAENKEFFLNANSPSNFERTWKNITFVYKELGLLDTPVRFDEVMDFSVLQKLETKGTFADMKNEYVTQFSPTTYSKVAAEKPILTQTIRINFYPNSSNIFEPQHDEFGNALASTLYDPNATATLEKVGRLAGQYERAVIAVVGHTDSSMKGKVPRSEVERLSLDRANSVKNSLVKKYNFDPNKFVIQGKAWDEPADANDPMNQALNRRVEISVYPPEK
ncbi:MAG TPA: phosphate ABC transporter substrate-binding/OmpA family protein [Acidobacteriota bacterium]|nr:OmpA family protein [Acidobacteriota bacterium]HNR38875.1 phosphate ABC transporter substrate-binding/OmpA family protein [Acidobacteriota bacterium]HNU00163.1 phosphate ABC transporter substrate-binding/OmpA family protein [Acidobacteriota bacterium]HPB28924.1 phosphate ABC transporter substrate-binding/OmpA family protein [Acidobacteriota bacterium]HQP73620.1 phosphate ABC transporter substrate-binding/OmpA family protein [Acidobacteriota bacterium]